eukprot:m.66476 g.66476  ORF g.66476 m.66476 type:complete len:536 (-) comp19725_c0_seq2:26-1633(-)
MKMIKMTMMAIMFMMLARVVAITSRPPSPQAVTLQRALNNTIASGGSSFTLPSDQPIDFGDMAFVIASANNINIHARDSKETTLIFSPQSRGVWIQHSTNVKLIGVRITYSPLPFVHGVVLSSNVQNKTMRVKLDADSLTFAELVKELPAHDTWPPTVTFNANGDIFASCGWGRPAPASPTTTPGEYILQSCPPYTNQSNGFSFASPTRYRNTYTVLNSSHTWSENIVIEAASYMAVVEANGYGNNTYRHITINSPRQSSPLGANADAFHSTGTIIGPTLENCFFRNTDDDFFNVHNTLQLAARPNTTTSTNSLIVIDGQLFSGQANTNYGTFQTLSYLQTGTSAPVVPRASLFAVNELQSPLLHSLEIVSLERLVGNETDAVVQKTHDYLNSLAKSCPLSACGAGVKNLAAAQIYNVTFKTPLPPPSTSALPPFMFFNLDSHSALSARIRNNVFSYSAANFGRMKSTYGTIANNTFRHANTWNMEVGPLQDYLEGMANIHNISITNNTFSPSQGGASPIHIFAAEGVQESGNRY